LISSDDSDDERRASGAGPIRARSPPPPPLVPRTVVPEYLPYQRGTYLRDHWVGLHPNLRQDSVFVVDAATGTCYWNLRYLGHGKLDWGKASCLLGSEWLNDEVVNFFSGLLQIRQMFPDPSAPPLPRCMFFNTFIYKKLMHGSECGYTFKNVRRWMRKRDFRGQELAIFPINVGGSHWVLSVVFFRSKRICHYDSLGGQGVGILSTMERLMHDVAEDCGVPELRGPWNKVSMRPPSIPLQMDGSACGVFVCAFSDCIARGHPPSGLSQSDIPDMRASLLRLLGFN
jgi:hypothetical protein